MDTTIYQCAICGEDADPDGVIAVSHDGGLFAHDWHSAKELQREKDELTRCRITVWSWQAGAGTRERCDGCQELIGNHHVESCPSMAKLATVAA